MTDADRCRLCGEAGGVDFHHWRYSDDTGCSLCRSCHAYIHDPDGARPGDGPGNEWVEVALPRLLKRHRLQNPFIVSVSRVMDHYSLPEKYRPRVAEVLQNDLEVTDS